MPPYGLGWLRDHPDVRDHRLRDHPDAGDHRPSAYPGRQGAAGTLARRLLEPRTQDTRRVVDLRQWQTPVLNQGSTNSCTANAGANAMGMAIRVARGGDFLPSRLFLYGQTRRRLMHIVGDVGAYLRSTMGALRLFGVPPEEEWPFDPAKIDVLPDPDLFAMADDFRGTSYLRIDAPGVLLDEVLATTKTLIGLKVPVLCGFTVYGPAIRYATLDRTGRIAFPGRGDTPLGGHAVLLCGYNDNMEIFNQGLLSKDSPPAVGAFLFKNSWGEEWGEAGYGFLPYQYLGTNATSGMMSDIWALLRVDWIDLGVFRP